jgi:hypothetical protein
MKKAVSTAKKNTHLVNCSGIVLDLRNGLVNGNRNSERVAFRTDRHDRVLFEYLMINQGKNCTYSEIGKLIDLEIQDSHLKNSKIKVINDKIEAIKRKLMVLGFNREELKMMFHCDRGYTLMPIKKNKFRKLGAK